MQIICNSCLSANIYNDIYNVKYNNPFIGCIWTPETMIKFVKHYRNIDYTNIKLSLSEIDEPHFYRLFKSPHIICNVDNLLTIRYVHSYENCKNNFDEFKDTYFRRLKRFNINETPIFIMGYGFQYADYYAFSYDYNSCIKFNFLNANTIQFSSSFKDLPVGSKNNKYIYVESTVPLMILKYHKTQLKNTLDEFLNVRN